jgi:hypothetical protein
MNYWEAHAILDMDDHGYSESLGPHQDESRAAWTKLVAQAEEITGRLAYESELRNG